MAKQKKRKKKADETPAAEQAVETAPAEEAAEAPATEGPSEGGKPESVAGYFRRLFQENPRLLGEKSNQKLLDRWLADHPDQTEVPKSVKANLANLKSVLRSKKRRKAPAAQPAEGGGSSAHDFVATRPRGSNALEELEQQIDECLTLARTQDREGLENVIQLLRRARNAVVWKIGQ